MTSDAPGQRPRSGPVDLGMLYRLLEVDEDEPVHELVYAARKHSRSLPPLILSLLERDGRALGTGSRDELARARNRAATYGAVSAAIQQATSARVVKGPSIARNYPGGLFRPVGDLDIVVADEGELWTSVRVISELYPVEHIDVSIFGHHDEHFVVAASWPADDSVLDSDCKVDLSTVAFTGDLETVAPRLELPVSPFLADLFSLAEERFRRTFGPKDVIDVVVLSTVNVPPLDSIVATAAHLSLAPELKELLETASEYASLGPLQAVIPALAEPARAEAERRQKPTASGFTLQFGLLLQSVPWRAGMRRSHMHSSPSGKILRAPGGDYLMVTQDLVTRSQFDAALCELESLGSPQEAAAEGP